MPGRDVECLSGFKRTLDFETTTMMVYIVQEAEYDDSVVLGLYESHHDAVCVASEHELGAGVKCTIYNMYITPSSGTDEGEKTGQDTSIPLALHELPEAAQDRIAAKRKAAHEQQAVLVRERRAREEVILQRARDEVTGFKDTEAAVNRIKDVMSELYYGKASIDDYRNAQARARDMIQGLCVPEDLDVARMHLAMQCK